MSECQCHRCGVCLGESLKVLISRIQEPESLLDFHGDELPEPKIPEHLWAKNLSFQDEDVQECVNFEEEFQE